MTYRGIFARVYIISRYAHGSADVHFRVEKQKQTGVAVTEQNRNSNAKLSSHESRRRI